MDFEQIIEAIDANDDGPYSANSVAGAAEAIARLVRYLNNATQHQHVLPYPAAVDDLLAGLHTAAVYSDQLIKQLALAAHRFADDPSLRDDRGGQHIGGDTAGALVDALEAVRDTAADYAQALDRARSHSVHLGQAG